MGCRGGGGAYNLNRKSSSKQAVLVFVDKEKMFAINWSFIKSQKIMINQIKKRKATGGLIIR